MTGPAAQPVTLRFQCIEWAREDANASGLAHFHVFNRAQDYFDFLTASGPFRISAAPLRPDAAPDHGDGRHDLDVVWRASVREGAKEVLDMLHGTARTLSYDPVGIWVSVYSPQALAALKALPPCVIRDTLSEVLDTVLCYLASEQPDHQAAATGGQDAPPVQHVQPPEPPARPGPR